MENIRLCYSTELVYKQPEQEEIVPTEIKELLKVIPDIEVSKETLQKILAQLETKKE